MLVGRRSPIANMYASQAFHAGFSLGFNCGEAVNFATADWIPIGRECLEKYRSHPARTSVIAHDRLVLELAQHFVRRGKEYATTLRKKIAVARSDSGGCSLYKWHIFCWQRQIYKTKTHAYTHSGTSPPPPLFSFFLSLVYLIFNDLLTEDTTSVATAEVAQTSETLDAVDTTSLRLLLSEMRNITEEETINRSLINERGVTQAVHLHRLPSGEKEEAQCIVCKHSCWLACVVCPCNVRNVACPRHFEHLCRCDNRRKCFIFWWKVSQLRAIVAELEKTVAELEMLEAELKTFDG